MKKIIYIIVFTVFALSCSAKDQDPKIARMDSLFDNLASNNRFMGTITVTRNGSIIYQKAVGIRNFNEGVAVQPDIDTKYRIGSITKVYTAVMIMKLVEEKKLTVNTPLSDFFPQIKNSKSITIDHMLHHSSGLHNFTNDPEYRHYLSKQMTQEEILKIFASAEPDFEPGSKNDYSNTNYVLLGYIIEKVTGKPYSEVLKSMICDRIGLKNTYYGGRINNTFNEASSYKYSYQTEKWEILPETHMSIPHGAGAVVSNGSDIVTFLESLFEGRLLSPENLEYMKTIRDGIGAGLFQMPFHDKESFGHTGGIDGFSSLASYFPEEKLGVALLSNGNNYNNNDIMIGVLSIYFDKPYKIPSFKAFQVAEDVLDSYTGSYTSEQLPLEIKISRSGKILTAQATGQSAFPLEAVNDNEFRFTAAGVVIVFSKSTGSNAVEFVLKQAGQEYKYRKK